MPAPRSTAPAVRLRAIIDHPHDGCPPPPLGFPGPTHGIRVWAGAGLSCGPFPGPPGPGWQFGHGGGGSNGAALASPTPNVSADMPTPIAIAAALAMRFTYICGSSPRRLRCSPRWLPATQVARHQKTTAATPHSDATVLPLRIVTTSKCTGKARLSRGTRVSEMRRCAKPHERRPGDRHPHNRGDRPLALATVPPIAKRGSTRPAANPWAPR
jgi:hypothetical protein